MTTVDGTSYIRRYRTSGGPIQTGARSVIYYAAGNRLLVSDSGTQTVYTTNNLNQYITVGGTSYSYDLDGNLTSETNASGTIIYQYDEDNRPISLSEPDGDTWEYVYDALGNRISVTHNGVETQYLHDPVGLVDVAAEYDGSGTLLARYVHGYGLLSRQDAGGDAAYYAFDGTGNTRQMTDEAGIVVNMYEYDPFGVGLQISEAMPNPFQYVGKFGVMGDGDNLLFMRARFYSQPLGRFISEDPLGLQGGSSNLYAYAANNPISYIDPLGLVIIVEPDFPERLPSPKSPSGTFNPYWPTK
jgi:RHS repeat-associated protein